MENKVWELLKEVRFPGMSRDIVSFGFVDRVKVDGDRVVVDLAIATHNRASADQVSHHPGHRREPRNLVSGSNRPYSASKPPV